MALSTARIHRVRGRPPLLAAGITSLIHSHSSSVRSLGYIFSFIYPFYTTREDFSDRLSYPVTLPHHLGQCPLPQCLGGRRGPHFPESYRTALRLVDPECYSLDA